MLLHSPTDTHPWRAKRGILPKLSTFLSQLKGGPFGEKTNFRKVSQCRKTEGGPFGIFKHPICCKISKKLKGGPFGEKKILEKKSHNAEKLKGGTLWSRPVWYVTRKKTFLVQFARPNGAIWCNNIL